ncbi:hypothetical protein [Bradyrhizobium sp. SZCCHNRI1002]|uniref:hypothetical protein n=1 Tax=Bradyrhizobium sp. SZCCHNRI1002 TaxID=3057274 RepID=UPI0028EDDD75|nr:hypothetical protein [Bradyrhizobium sp. SZCCHNRI1002]
MSRRHKPLAPIVNVNLPLRLPGGRTLLLAPIKCPKCTTVARPIDVEIDDLPRLICRTCGATIFEVQQCA